MRKIILVALVVVGVLVLYFGISWFWPAVVDNKTQPDSHSQDDSQTAQSVNNQAAIAEPGLGGFYQVNWTCQASHQFISFHILTTGEGYLDVTIETINPTTRPHTVAKVLTERVYVNDNNRDQVEARVFSSVIPSGHGVHIGLAGENGARTSEDRTLTPISC